MHRRSVAAGLAAAVLMRGTALGKADPLIEPHMRIAKGAAAGPQIALTLDACMGEVDERILTALLDNQAPATIFATGRWLLKNFDAIKVLLAHPELFQVEDHGLNHTPAIIGAEHPYGIRPAGTADAVRHEVMGGFHALATAGFAAPHWFRGATALYTPDAMALIGSDLKLRIAGFSLNADLGASVDAATAQRRFETAQDGDVIIAHINQPKRPAGEGIAKGIATMKARGYRFVRLKDVEVLPA